MIFYFTGTGNSLWVAKQLAKKLNDKVISIADTHSSKNYNFDINQSEKIGFVFPIHSWGIPPIVREFISKLTINQYDGQTIYGVFTCGDECGYTDKMFRKLLATKGWQSQHIYSVRMPNSYICFPKFDIDSKELEQQKVDEAAIAITHIAEAISNNSPISLYHKGHLNFLKSRIIYPQFIKHALSSRPFYTTDLCTHCGLCANSCPTHNITMVDGKPKWGNCCTQCLACIHHCPQRAIEYGKLTQSKGRYNRFANQKETD